MDTKTLKSGSCPRCSSGEVYSNVKKAKYGIRQKLNIATMKWYSLDTYICTDCGHFEEYIPEEEFKNAKIIEKIKKDWSKVK